MSSRASSKKKEDKIMNKFGVVLGITAAVAIAGCMDPNYKVPARGGQNEVKDVPAAVEAPAPEPVVVTPDKKFEKSPDDMPYFDFMVRDALIDIRWGETLAENGLATEGDVTTVRLKSGKAIRCATFRNIS